MPRAYAPEFRRQVIDLIERGHSVTEVAAMVEPTEQAIHNWWNRHLVDTFRRAGGHSANKRVSKGGGYPKSWFEAISRMADVSHAVERAFRITGVFLVGFYTWRMRTLSERMIRQAWPLDQIVEIHAARRVQAEFTLGRGLRVGHNAVEMLMSRPQIYSLLGPKRSMKVPCLATATDLVECDFARIAPDRLWASDITEHPRSLTSNSRGHAHIQQLCKVTPDRLAQNRASTISQYHNE